MPSVPAVAAATVNVMFDEPIFSPGTKSWIISNPLTYPRPETVVSEAPNKVIGLSPAATLN